MWFAGRKNLFEVKSLKLFMRWTPLEILYSTTGVGGRHQTERALGRVPKSSAPCRPSFQSPYPCCARPCAYNQGDLFGNSGKDNTQGMLYLSRMDPSRDPKKTRVDTAEEQRHRSLAQFGAKEGEDFVAEQEVGRVLCRCCYSPPHALTAPSAE